MKKLLCFSLLLVSIGASSQTFEGILRWSMKTEMSPAMKTQLDQGMQMLKDPAVQAKMKEMMEKMSDPQTKALMDANPQMKSQMENMLKQMQGGATPDMSSLVPTGFTVKVKEGNTLATMEGGAMQMEILFLKEQDKTVRLDRKNKTFSVLTGANSSRQTNALSVSVTKTKETAKILGYTCTKYIAAVTENEETVNQVYWTTTEIKDLDVKSLTKQRMMGGGQSLFYDGIEGVPLKIEMSVQEAKIVMEIADIKREKLNTVDFTVPVDFKETQGGAFPR
ncbi:MAG: DUF4412 domain-containing protein [Flavobacteriales bacterium]